MTNTKKVVLAKLFGKQANTKLSKARKLKLSVVDDIESEANSLEEAYQEASYYANERFDEILDEIADFQSNLSIEVDNAVVNGSATYLEEAGSNMLALIEKLETGAEDLGVDPSELLYNYEDIKQMAEGAQELYDDFVSKYKEVVKESSNGLATFLSKTPKKK
jgi:hypothetical protein